MYVVCMADGGGSVCDVKDLTVLRVEFHFVVNFPCLEGVKILL